MLITLVRLVWVHRHLHFLAESTIRTGALTNQRLSQVASALLPLLRASAKPARMKVVL